MDIITVSAKTLDEAITKALLELQTTSEHLHYEIVQKESSGFLVSVPNHVSSVPEL